VTNGLGGFACGTVAGANTRRYHGFLTASLAPPLERTLLVAKFDIAALYLGRRYDLSANEFAGGAVAPQGFVHLQSFEVRDGIPTWRYAIADALLEMRIFMAPLANTAYLKLELVSASAALAIELKPFVTYRGYHSQARGAANFRIDAGADGFAVRAADSARPYRVAISGGRFTAGGVCYWNFYHREEAERGLDALEDLWMPGCLRGELAAGGRLFVSATAEAAAAADGADVERQVEREARQLAAAAPKSAPAWVRELAVASNQFIVRRGAAADADSGIIAGYPWFGEWGRDAMISLPGLATILGRHEIAAGVLSTYARYVDGGMLPNRLPEGNGACEYNTADATLWLFHALDEHLAAHADRKLEDRLFPVLIGIVKAHVEGTRYSIRVDRGDGLLHAGEPGSQLTWMDAKQGARAFTPRVGKPVEINALWLNALDVMARLAKRRGEESAHRVCRELLNAASAGFRRFWNAEQGCLYDVLDVDGGTAPDASVRPNQLFAVSLPYSVLTNAEQRSIVDICARELLTSYGLRSLRAADPAYLGRYAGDAYHRDAAYHQGTVWSWLLGPFAWAHYRAYGDARAAQAYLAPMALRIGEACLGTVGEILDGDAPHAARGCFAQAWSVAEILRCWIRLEREAAPPARNAR